MKRFILLFFTLMVLCLSVLLVWNSTKKNMEKGEEESTKETLKLLQTDPVEINQNLCDPYVFDALTDAQKGTYIQDFDGNIVCDKNGNILYDGNKDENNEILMQNLKAIIWHFQNLGYPKKEIYALERFYASYASQLQKYSYEELIQKMESVFPLGTMDQSFVSAQMKYVFGYEREDGFSFLFEDISYQTIKIYFSDVKRKEMGDLPYEIEEFLKEIGYEEGSVRERNLPIYLSEIYDRFSTYKKEKRVLYYTVFYEYLLDALYIPSYLEILDNFPLHGKTYGEFCLCLEKEFQIEINECKVVEKCYKEYMESEEMEQ